MYTKTDFKLLAADKILYLKPNTHNALYTVHELKLTPALKLMIPYLQCKFAIALNSDKPCIATNGSIAADLGMNASSVASHMKNLQRAGIIAYSSIPQTTDKGVTYTPRQITAVIDVFNSDAHRLVMNENKKAQYKATKDTQSNSKGKAKGLYIYDKKASERAGRWVIKGI